MANWTRGELKPGTIAPRPMPHCDLMAAMIPSGLADNGDPKLPVRGLARLGGSIASTGC